MIIDRPGGEVDTFQETAQVKWGDMEFIHMLFFLHIFYTFQEAVHVKWGGCGVFTTDAQVLAVASVKRGNLGLKFSTKPCHALDLLQFCAFPTTP